MSSHLSSGRINVGHLREAARLDMINSFAKYHGTKAIVWDSSIIGPFGLLADFNFLKNECGCVQMIPLRGGHLPVIRAENIVYIIRPQVSLMKIIAENIIEEHKGSKPTIKFHILFMPRRSLVCEKKLEDLNVLNYLSSIEEYPVDLFPFDSDVISMEMPSAFGDFLEDDNTGLYHAARAIMVIQALFGIIPNVYGQGKAAKHVFELIVRMRRELEGKEPQMTPQIDCVLLIDRTVDLLSPLVTQLTYEGLLDEIYGINNNTIKLPPEKFLQKEEIEKETTDPTTQMKQFHLNSAEELFAKIRDKNFNAVGPILSQTAKGLSAQYEESQHAKSVSELKEFVQKMPQFQSTRKSLAKHTSIAELVRDVTDSEEFRETLEVEQEFLNTIDTDRINAYIEDCIGRQDPLTKVLRLICIQSITNNGLKPKVLDYYRREIVQTYGFHHLLTFKGLERAGLLKTSTSFVNKPYNVLKKTLKTVVEEVNEKNPTDISYVHSGYAPISARLAQFLVQPGWRAISEALKQLPEPTIEEVQQIPAGLRKRRNSISSTQSGGVEDQKVILVFFLGGCTYAEISALRFLSQQDEINAEFVIATTKLINGNSFLENFIADRKKLSPAK